MKCIVNKGKKITLVIAASMLLTGCSGIQDISRIPSIDNVFRFLETFDESYKRILNPHIYKVSLTEKLKDLKREFIEKNIK